MVVRGPLTLKMHVLSILRGPCRSQHHPSEADLRILECRVRIHRIRETLVTCHLISAVSCIISITRGVMYALGWAYRPHLCLAVAPNTTSTSSRSHPLVASECKQKCVQSRDMSALDGNITSSEPGCWSCKRASCSHENRNSKLALPFVRRGTIALSEVNVRRASTSRPNARYRSASLCGTQRCLSPDHGQVSSRCNGKSPPGVW